MEHSEVKMEIKTENKAVPIKFDDLSKEILKNCNPLMRETLINMGVRMVANSNMYNMYFLDTEERKNEFLKTLKEMQLDTSLTTDTDMVEDVKNTAPVTNVESANTNEPSTEVLWDDFT